MVSPMSLMGCISINGSTPSSLVNNYLDTLQNRHLVNCFISSLASRFLFSFQLIREDFKLSNIEFVSMLKRDGGLDQR